MSTLRILQTGFPSLGYRREASSNLLLLLISLLFGMPLMVVCGSILFPAWEIWAHLIDAVLLDYIGNSLLLLTGVAALSLILGVIPAWLVTMYRFPLSRRLEWALLLPMAMPAYIIAYSYAGMLDVAGPVQTLLREQTGWNYRDYWFPEVRSLGGAVVMLALVLYPYIYLLARAAFIEQSICVLEVSRTLGCNGLDAFRRVALPLARPAIVVGLSLVVMETLADYGTVQYFGVPTFTVGIFRTWFGLGSSLAAAQLSVLLLCFVATFLYLEKQSRRQARFHHTSNRYSILMRRQLLGGRAALALAYCLVPLCFGFLVPLCRLFSQALNAYTDVLNTDFYHLLLHSLSLAFATALIALALALFMVYTNRNRHARINLFMVRFVSLGYAIPGTVIAVGVLIPFAWLNGTLNTFFPNWSVIDNGLFFYGALFTLIFAYLVRFLAVSINTVEAGLGKIKPTMDEAAKTAGISPVNIVKRIHIPMMRGSLLTALLLIFVDVLKELPATLLLRPFNFNTLAVRAYEFANEERLADAAVPALAIVLAGIIPVILISNSISRSRPGHA